LSVSLGILSVKIAIKINSFIKFIFVLFSSPFVVASQKCIIACFIASFYFGTSFYAIQKAPLDFADISFMIISLAYFSYMLVPSIKRPKLNPSVKPVFYSLCAFIAWCIVSALINLSRHSADAGWQSIWFIMNFIQLPIGLYVFSSSSLQKYRSFILTVILCFSFLEMGIAFYQYFILSDIPASGTVSLHHAMLGNMMVFAAVISLYRLLMAKKTIFRLAFGFLFFLSLYTIILSQTRSILGGVAIALTVFLVRFLKFTWKYLSIVGMSLFVLYVIIKVTPMEKIINQTIHSRDTPIALDMSSFGRLLIWKGSVDHFLMAPIGEKLIGCGPGKFSTVPFAFFVFNTKGSSGAHNNFLHTLIETGIVGLLLFLLFFTVTLLSLHRHSKKDPLALLYFYGTITLLGSGLSQETFWMQYVFGNFWLFYIIFLGLIFGKPTTSEVSKEKQ
jgi:O-antigen ligase